MSGVKKMPKVLIPQDITEPGKDYLRSRGYDVIVGTGWDEQTIIREGADCEAILARTAPYTRTILFGLPKLKVISRHGVGVDNIDLRAAKERGIVVTNGPLSNYNSVSEHTIMLILECARKSFAVARAFREQGDFNCRNTIRGADVKDKVLGIVGLGRIGKTVAKKAHLGLDMKIIAYDPWVDPGTLPEYITMAHSVGRLLPEADFVSLHLPGGDETRHSFGMKQFRLMKPTAYLINVARGEIVAEGELTEALENGIIAGAGLDVFTREPVGADNPLLKMDRVIATPHSAGLTREAMDLSGVYAAVGIDEVLTGKQPSWAVRLPD